MAVASPSHLRLKLNGTAVAAKRHGSGSGPKGEVGKWVGEWVGEWVEVSRHVHMCCRCTVEAQPASDAAANRIVGAPLPFQLLTSQHFSY